MSVWLVLPSKRRPEEALPNLHKWIDAGYNVLVQRDPVDPISVAHIEREYAGYAEAVNFLVRMVLESEPEANWILCAGDDMLPDPHKGPEEIARECEDHFHAGWCDDTDPTQCLRLKTFGVMQPTGDDFGANPNYPDPALRGAYCTRVAGSPWMGREFCRRMYGGNGPLWPGYFHNFEDQELQEVATKLGVFWQRPDLCHKHMHWARPEAGERMGHSSRMPEFLKRANSPEQWKVSREMYESRKAAGFPGHEPIP